MLRVGVAVPFVSPTTFPDGVDSDSFAITFVYQTFFWESCTRAGRTTVCDTWQQLLSRLVLKHESWLVVCQKGDVSLLFIFSLLFLNTRWYSQWKGDSVPSYYGRDTAQFCLDCRLTEWAQNWMNLWGWQEARKLWVYLKKRCMGNPRLGCTSRLKSGQAMWINMAFDWW
jgi:hypothetical protein